MSINWVMLTSSGTDFVRLPNESLLFTSPARVSLSLDSVNKFPGKQPWQFSCAAGKMYLTSRRIIYIPSTPTALPPTTTPTATLPQPTSPFTLTTAAPSNAPSSSTPAPSPTPTKPSPFTSLNIPHGHLHNTHVTTPWLGPNAWAGALQPVRDGGLPAHLQGLELRMTFKDGGAFDWHAKYCEVVERLAQVREAREASGARAEGEGDGGVHLEQLPAYEEGVQRREGGQVRVSGTQEGGTQILAPVPVRVAAPTSLPAATTAPGEMPPAYEESQREHEESTLDELGRLGVGERS